MAELKFMAVWPYDRFPHFLCGEVIAIRDDGAVSTKEYGGMWFMPAVMLPLSELPRIKGIHKDLVEAEATMKREMERQLKNYARQNAPKVLHGLIGVKP